MNTFNIFKSFQISKLLPQSEKKKRGQQNGGVSYVGRQRTEKVSVSFIDYSTRSFLEKEVADIKELESYKKKKSVTWINVSGVHDTKKIEEIGDMFNIHPLTQQDIANTTQRPKAEEYEDYVFLVFKMAYYEEKTNDIVIEQISLILADKFIISFQERPGDIFDPLRAAIKEGKRKIRTYGTDYLMYSIADSIIDNYFSILERVGEEIEKIEERLINNLSDATLKSIYRLKRELIFLRKSVWPMRDVIVGLQRGDYKNIKKSTSLYLRDVYDHTIQVAETLETFRDMTSTMLDLYLSSISNKMNEVMKVLTIFAAIFIPLTLVSGIYGMNFSYMPGLDSPFGFYGVVGFMTLIAIGMIVIFKHKKWM